MLGFGVDSELWTTEQTEKPNIQGEKAVDIRHGRLPHPDLKSVIWLNMFVPDDRFLRGLNLYSHPPPRGRLHPQIHPVDVHMRGDNPMLLKDGGGLKLTSPAHRLC